MVYLKQQRPEKVTVPAVLASKERGERLVCLTAYDYPTARIVDEAGTDIILVGDSLGNVVLGYDTTVPVTLDEMVMHTRAVRRGVTRALLVADMPYGSYHTGADDAVRAALRLIKEGGAESVNKLGGFRLQGKTAEAARGLIADARALEEAGAFSVVLEVVPREIAKLVTAAVSIPTIGIGAGEHCDAQILVIHDLLGISFTNPPPPFARQYADLRAAMTDAIARFADDVRGGAYPGTHESYPLPADAAAELQAVLTATDDAG